MSLVAQQLEAAGVVTVVIGSARDIVEEAGVPRFVFSDVPLGSPLGAPDDADTQIETVTLALELAMSAFTARTTIQSSVRWDHEDWRRTYMLVDDSNRAELAEAGNRRRAAQAARK